MRVDVEFEVSMTTALLIVSLLSVIAAALIAYVIGYWARTSVTSSKSDAVTKETACQAAGNDETDHGGLLQSVHPCLTLAQGHFNAGGKLH